MLNMEFIELTTEIQQLITAEQAWHYSIIPKSNGSFYAFYIDRKKYSSSINEELEMLFGKQVKLLQHDTEIIKKSLGKYYRKQDATQKQQKTQLNATDYKSDDFLHKLIEEAKTVNSSDIHIESYEERCRVRLRIDGKLIEKYTIAKSEYPSLINKIKIKANLDIAEKRLPQDGRIFFKTNNSNFDIRVSSLPSLHGEKIVLRLLSKDATEIDINYLGLAAKQQEDYLKGLKKSHGIVLISGPTGSGKTTTLYASLKTLNTEETNILTVEDPIEYTLEGINQVQLKESIGLTFSSALRTFLRQDPDIIMLGEIRDAETAQMAIRAALTGHLVLSTVHTNSAWGTISRLIDMGVPAFLIADTINLSVAQRLVRLLCPNCKKEETQIPESQSILLDKNCGIKTHFVPVGCDQCYYTGYKGRKAVFEVIPIDSVLAESIKKEEYSISNYLKEKGIKSMADIAIEMVKAGETSLSEIYPIQLNNR